MKYLIVTLLKKTSPLDLSSYRFFQVTGLSVEFKPCLGLQDLSGLFFFLIYQSNNKGVGCHGREHQIQVLVVESSECGFESLSWLSGLEHQIQVLVVESLECGFESWSWYLCPDALLPPLGTCMCRG